MDSPPPLPPPRLPWETGKGREREKSGRKEENPGGGWMAGREKEEGIAAGDGVSVSVEAVKKSNWPVFPINDKLEKKKT